MLGNSGCPAAKMARVVDTKNRANDSLDVWHHPLKASLATSSLEGLTSTVVGFKCVIRTVGRLFKLPL
jgi:hypothetical protein